jgi:hypothetical protein
MRSFTNFSLNRTYGKNIHFHRIANELGQESYNKLLVYVDNNWLLFPREVEGNAF